MGFNEVKECCKGHVSMGEKIADKSLNYIGKRHMGRLMSDAYGRGIVRGQAENTNLRAYAKEYDVTLASLCMFLKFNAMRAKSDVQSSWPLRSDFPSCKTLGCVYDFGLQELAVIKSLSAQGAFLPDPRSVDLSSPTS